MDLEIGEDVAIDQCWLCGLFYPEDLVKTMTIHRPGNDEIVRACACCAMEVRARIMLVFPSIRLYDEILTEDIHQAAKTWRKIREN
jgi:hypothetical protein